MGKLPMNPLENLIDFIPKGNRIMAANPQLDGTVFTVSRFQACATDLRQTMAHLQAIEEEMADTVQEMRSQDGSRERLLIAEDMLADLRAALSELGYVRRIAQSPTNYEQPAISLAR